MPSLSVARRVGATAWSHRAILSALTALGACSADLGGTAPGGGAGEGGVPTDAALDAGASGDAGDGSLPSEAGPVARSCDGVPSGGSQTQPGYRAPLAQPPALCEPGEQTRTCLDGTWSAFGGDYPYPVCEVVGFDSCDGEPHGSVQTRYAYAASQAASASACAAAASAVTRSCNDGAWSAWTAAPPGSAESCTIVAGGGCATEGALAGYGCATGSTCDGSRCVLPGDAACAQNVECAGTCVASRCVAMPPVLGACDDTDDCSATACSTGAQCVSGQCLCNDGSACGTDNGRCVNTCRAGSCTPRGGACDAEDQSDCIADDPCYQQDSFWICVSDVGVPCAKDEACQVVCVAGACGTPVGLRGECDNDADCESPLRCASVSWSVAKRCLRDKGGLCTSAESCVSESCSSQGGGVGVCQ